ncbi:MAG: ABC transporter substrate-binding protein [Clostridiales bacterium]|jgi:iron complex transport system substrate-binding protein|nr:ABC transporter substrate-binding protein [Clostridiales bacterium]
MFKNTLRYAALLCAAALSFLFVACGGDNPDAGDQGDFTPVTIQHAFGETVIDKKPERVVTLYFGNQDIVLALGVVPVGFSMANFGITEVDKGMLPWTRQRLAELGEKNPNVFNDLAGTDMEAVAACEPDLILAPYSAMPQEEYDTLSLICPVVPYPEGGAWAIQWKEWIRVTAKALGMAEKGESVIAETDALIQAKGAEHPEIAGKKIVWANFRANNLSTVGTYTPSDTRGTFLLTLGMDYPQGYYDLWTDRTKYNLSLSSEHADVMNGADAVIGYGDDATWDAVKAHAVWGQTNPIKNGAIAAMGNGGYLAASGTATPLSIEYTIDAYLNLIGDALAHNA